MADNIRYGRPDASRQEVEDAAEVANARAFIEVCRLASGKSQNISSRFDPSMSNINGTMDYLNCGPYVR